MYTIYLKWTYDYAFNDDCVLNEYVKPKFNTFKRILSVAKKHLENFISKKHSPVNANDNEQYPLPIKAIIESWLVLKQGAEDSQSQLQRNRQVQDEVIGGRTVIGSDPNVAQRASIKAENKRKGLPTVEHASDLPGALTLTKSPGLDEDNTPEKVNKR